MSYRIRWWQYSKLSYDKCSHNTKSNLIETLIRAHLHRYDVIGRTSTIYKASTIYRVSTIYRARIKAWSNLSCGPTYFKKKTPSVDLLISSGLLLSYEFCWIACVVVGCKWCNYSCHLGILPTAPSLASPDLSLITWYLPILSCSIFSLSLVFLFRGHRIHNILLEHYSI